MTLEQIRSALADRKVAVVARAALVGPERTVPRPATAAAQADA